MTFCADCETMDIAMCDVFVIIWNERAMGIAAVAIGGTTAVVLFCDSNRSTPSSDITRLRQMPTELGEFPSPISFST